MQRRKNRARTQARPMETHSRECANASKTVGSNAYMPPGSTLTDLRCRLISRFRSSPQLATGSDASFGIERHLRARLHQLGLARLSPRDLEHVVSIDLVHSDEGSGHAAASSHELPTA